MTEKGKTALLGLGAIAGAGLLGYIVYRLVAKPAIDHPDINPAPAAEEPKPQLPSGVPSGSVAVSKGQQVVAQAYEIVSGKTKGDRYVAVQIENKDSYGRDVVEFKSPIDGYFTGRLYVHGNKHYAELMKA